MLSVRMRAAHAHHIIITQVNNRAGALVHPRIPTRKFTNFPDNTLRLSSGGVWCTRKVNVDDDDGDGVGDSATASRSTGGK